MKEGLLIGGGVIVAGVFVGYVAYRVIKKKPKLFKNTKLLKKTKEAVSNVGKKTSAVASEAKRAFAEGFQGAQTKKATQPKVATA
ncbi:MAG: hypothetical protein ACYS17_11000 [Planctomycetota bacterium]|jgi:hypothetical protein